MARTWTKAFTMDEKTKNEARSRSDVSASPYTPIENYAMVGDCRTAALISSSGSIDWLCLPNFSAPSLFAALIDRHRGGYFTVRPVAPSVTTRRYVESTSVLETEFHTASGILRLTDLMPVVIDDREARTLYPQRELLRRLDVITGEVEVTIEYVPRPCYGDVKPRLRRLGALGWRCAHKNMLYSLHTDIPLSVASDGASAHARIRLRQGERRYLSLVLACSDVAVIAPLGAEAEARIAATCDWWRRWSARCTYQGQYRDLVLRSAITLKLLTFGLSGAMVAAPTTSLPEKIGGERNWDYRYCWLRDASLTVGTFIDLGFHTEAESFLSWLLHATRLTQPELQVVYDVYGETRIPERERFDMEGYRNSRPVRIGNAAHRQLQLDTYGSVALAAYDFVQGGGKLQRDESRFLAALGSTVCAQWRMPDHGIWEIRGSPRHYTYSKLMCWVALDRLIRLHDAGEIRAPVERFRRERDIIADAIRTYGFDTKADAYGACFNSATADASLLLMARYGFCTPQDERMRATFQYIDRELGRGPLLYRLAEGADGLAPGEGAFLIASFWAVDYLARSGEIDAARRRFEQLLTLANDVGLYAEEVEPENGAALGNFPQAFSHVGLILAALALEQNHQTKT